MPKLDSYLERKRVAIAERQAAFRAAPRSSNVTVSVSSRVAGITGARPVRIGETTIITDSGPGLAGHALGPTSPELLLGALASCLVHTYLVQAVFLDIALDDVQVQVSAGMDYAPVVGLPSAEPYPRLENVTYQAHIESPAAAEEIQRLHEVVEATCTVLNTLRHPVDVRRA